MWISSGRYIFRIPPMVSEPVFMPSIWILYHFLSSRRMVSRLPRELCRAGMMMSLCLRSSSAVWSALVEMIRFPWLLKLAATTFRCLEVLLAVRAVLIWVAREQGSGLLSGGIPRGRNCAISLEGW